MGGKKEESVEERAQRLLITARMPRIWVLSTLFVAIVALGFGVLPLISEIDQMLKRAEGRPPAQGSFARWSASIANPGPISRQHKLFGQDCSACHQKPFSGVSDEACLKCHSLTKHGHSDLATLVEERQEIEEDEVSSGSSLLTQISQNREMEETTGSFGTTGQSCVSCHMEHKGEVRSDRQATGDIRRAGDSHLSVQDSRLCTDCHGNLKQVAAETKLKDVKNLKEHPAYEVEADSGALKLNHAVHLKAGLRGSTGEETLQCSSCHHPEQNGRLFKAVSYQKDCARCHPLTFDPEMPGRQAPHGAPEEVLQYVFGEYAKLAALGGEKRGAKGLERLLDNRPTDSVTKQVTNHGSSYDLKDALDDALKAEKLIFTKTSCVLCHQVNQRQVAKVDLEKKSSLETSQSLDSNYEVVKPRVRQEWLKKARFDHSAHQTFACQGCHTGVKDSQVSSDVLIPEFSNCTNCHGENIALNKIALNKIALEKIPSEKIPSQASLRGFHITNGLNSSCTSCHGYHQSQYMANDHSDLLELSSQ